MGNCGVGCQSLEDQAVCASNSAKYFFRSTSIRLTFSSFSILIVYIFVLRSCQIGHDRILKPRAAAGERLAAIYTRPWTTFHPIPSHAIAPGTPLQRTRPDATNPPNPPRDIEQFTAQSLHNIKLSVARSLRQGPRPAPSRQRCRCLPVLQNSPARNGSRRSKSVAGSVAVVGLLASHTAIWLKNNGSRRWGELGEECDITRTPTAPILSHHRLVSLSSSLLVSSLCLPPHTLHRGTVSPLGWLKRAQFLRSSPRSQSRSTEDPESVLKCRGTPLSSAVSGQFTSWPPESGVLQELF
jgi:hypothetical protein